MGNHLNREKYASFYRKIKEDAFMKIIRSIMNLIVVFVLWLEVGSFGVWYLTMSVLSPRRD